MMLCDFAALAVSNPRAGGAERASFDQGDVGQPACALLVALNGGSPVVSRSAEFLLRTQPGDLGAAARAASAAVSA